MDTIKVTDLVKKTAKHYHQGELIVHLRLQQAAQSLGMSWGDRIDVVSAEIIVGEAASRRKWAHQA